jgi:hypothetical protein
MATKKRGGGGGGSPGLVITLVFFILSTIGLGVATYYGFAEQADLEKKAKVKEVEAKAMTDQRDWYKFAYESSVVYFEGEAPPGTTLADVAKEKEAFDKGGMAAQKSSVAEIKASVAGHSALLNTKLVAYVPRWSAATQNAPPVTFKDELKRLVAVNQKSLEAVGAVRTQVTQAAQAAEKDKKVYEDAKLVYDGATKGIKATTDAHREKYKEMLAKLENDVVEEGKKVTKEIALKETAKAERDAARRKVTVLEGDLALAKKAEKKLKDSLTDAQSRMKDLARQITELNGKLASANSELASTRQDLASAKAEKAASTPTGAPASEPAAGPAPPPAVIAPPSSIPDEPDMPARTGAKLSEWNKDWRIVTVERLGTLERPKTYAYINLGKADGVTPGLTFSVHPRGPSGKISPAIKGTVEVIRSEGPGLSKVLVTSERDTRRDPIARNDLLFNSFWGTGHRKRVAIAGLIDLNGDGFDGTVSLMRRLKREGNQVDGWLDLNGKEPKMKGEGITASTDYLIIGTGVEGTRHPRANDKGFAKAVADQIDRARNRARANRVMVVDLERYRAMTGGGRR